MRPFVSKALQISKVIIEMNFCASVVVLMAGCFLSLSPSRSVFSFDQEIYGAMAGSLKIMMLYLGITEILVCLYFFFNKKPQPLIVVGAFLILMIGSLEFYGRINGVEIDAEFVPFLLYTGLSHIIFGVVRDLSKIQPVQHNPRDVY